MGTCVTEWQAPCCSIKNDSAISCWISLFFNSRAFLLSAKAINTLCPVKVRPHCVRPYLFDENKLQGKLSHQNTDFMSNRVLMRAWGAHAVHNDCYSYSETLISLDLQIFCYRHAWYFDILVFHPIIESCNRCDP